MLKICKLGNVIALTIALMNVDQRSQKVSVICEICIVNDLSIVLLNVGREVLIMLEVCTVCIINDLTIVPTNVGRGVLKIIVFCTFCIINDLNIVLLNVGQGVHGMSTICIGCIINGVIIVLVSLVGGIPTLLKICMEGITHFYHDSLLIIEITIEKVKDLIFYAHVFCSEIYLSLQVKSVRVHDTFVIKILCYSLKDSFIEEVRDIQIKTSLLIRFANQMMNRAMVCIRSI